MKTMTSSVIVAARTRDRIRANQEMQDAKRGNKIISDLLLIIGLGFLLAVGLVIAGFMIIVS